MRLIAGAGPSVPSAMLLEPPLCGVSGAFIAVAPCRRQVATSPPVMGGAAGTLLCKVSGAFIAVALRNALLARPAPANPSDSSGVLPETALCAGFGAFIAVAPCRRQVATSPPVMGEGGKPCWFAGLPLGRLPTVESCGFERGTAAAETCARQQSPRKAWRPACPHSSNARAALPELCTAKSPVRLALRFRCVLPDFINRPPVQLNSCIFAHCGRSAQPAFIRALRRKGQHAQVAMQIRFVDVNHRDTRMQHRGIQAQQKLFGCQPFAFVVRAIAASCSGAFAGSGKFTISSFT